MPWWLADRGQTLDRESVRVGLPNSLTRRLGDAMRASQKSKRKKAKGNWTLARVSSPLSMATHNVFNMVAVTAVSGAVLLTLLVAKHFLRLAAFSAACPPAVAHHVIAATQCERSTRAEPG